MTTSDQEADELLAVEIGSINDPPGSKSWAKAAVGETHTLRFKVGEDAKQLRRKLESIKEYNAHEALGFKSFEELCRKRLSLLPDQVRAILEAPPGISIATALGQHGGDRRSEAVKAEGEQVDIVKLPPPSGKGGNSATYLTARLDRDRPDIAAQVHAGELSARKGAILAGIIRELSPLEKAQAAFRRLVKEDRDAFDLWRAEQPL